MNNKIKWTDSIIFTNPAIPAGGTWTVTHEQFMDMLKQKTELLTIRGRVIESSLIIEERLNAVIANLFFYGEDTKIINKNELFKETVLNKEFFTLMNKWKVLKALCRSHKFIKEEKWNILLTKLHRLINFRYRFAHGEVIFKEAKQAILIYHQDGKKEDILNNDYFDNLNALFSDVDSNLQNIMRKLRDLYNKETMKDNSSKTQANL